MPIKQGHSSVSLLFHFLYMKETNVKPLSYFLPYLKQFAPRITVVFIILIGAKVATVLAPFYLKNIVDYLQTNITQAVVWEVILIALATYFGVRLIGVILNELKDFIFARVEISITRKVSKRVFEHILELSTRFHLEKKSGAIANMIQRGLAGIEFVFRFSLFNILPTLIEMFLVIGILLFNYHPIFAITTIVTLTLYLTFTVFIVEQRAKVQRVYNGHVNKAQGMSLDSLTNVDTVQLFTNKEFEVERYDKLLAEVESMALSNKTYLYLTNLGQGAINAIGMLVLLYFATEGVYTGAMTIGDFTLIIAYITQLSIPLGFIGFVYRQIKDSLVNMEDMFNLLNIEKEVKEEKDALALPSFQDNISLNNISFSYDGQREIFTDLSLTFPKGKTTAIVGPSGSGKTSISKLLLRTYDVQQGEVCIDGYGIKSLTVDSVRGLIGLVPQDTTLFNESVGFNIAYGNTDATQDEIEAAARKASIHDFIKSLPDGYDTLVGERGLRLSGGEKQRVAIARVILKGSPVILFDEATSSLDSKSESIIQEAIIGLAEERTMIIIAHRLSTIVHADNIIVLKHGALAEQGTHHELLANKGLYHELWQIQKQEQEKEHTQV